MRVLHRSVEPAAGCGHVCYRSKAGTHLKEKLIRIQLSAPLRAARPGEILDLCESGIKYGWRKYYMSKTQSIDETRLKGPNT